MDALDILRRSRAHKRSPLPIQLDVQPLIAGIENASNIDRDPNYRRSGEKRMTPEEVKAIQASMSQSVARAVASASQARAAGVSAASRVERITFTKLSLHLDDPGKAVERRSR